MALQAEREEPRLVPAPGTAERRRREAAEAEAKPRPATDRAPAVRRRRRRRRSRVSPLIKRILPVNLLALALLALGLLYLDDYEKGLIRSSLDSLHTQAVIVAGALGEGAVISAGTIQKLEPEGARALLRRLAQPLQKVRGRLFQPDGTLLADTRVLIGPGGVVEVEELPPPHTGSALRRGVFYLYDVIVDLVPRRERLPLYHEAARQRAADYDEVLAAMNGEVAERVRETAKGGLVLSVAVPVQRYKQVVGALMLSRGSAEIENSVRAVRFDVIKVFLVVLCITVLLSIYLAGTLARPVRLLAAAADRVRARQGRLQEPIPDLSHRGDEIGELSLALRQMTEDLWQRLDAIERFAADVSHEIKNPLTSLRSAVETAARLEDPAQQRRLMAIIMDDVQRLDRLITDISDASRLDAELSRAETAPVDIGRMLQALVELHDHDPDGDGPRLSLALEDAGALDVLGMEDRLVRVISNLIANAISFSPPAGEIRLRAWRDGRYVCISVDDNGPGVPEDNAARIFERFYSERPEGEKFGTHSGLGLSISKQIVAAHKGTIDAENRHRADGSIAGARFVVRLPAD